MVAARPCACRRLGLYFYNNPEALTKAALDACSITHTEPRARAASIAVAFLVARLVQANERSSPGDQVLETADRVASVDSDTAGVLRWVTQITHLSSEEALFEVGTSADAIEAIPAAIFCFLKHPKKYSSAVLSAVNAGDAADSVGALTGSFVGAFAGLKSIPENWRGGVENSDLLVGIGESLAELAAGGSVPRTARDRDFRGKANAAAGRLGILDNDGLDYVGNILRLVGGSFESFDNLLQFDHSNWILGLVE